MRKSLELAVAQSCLNKAHSDEMVFVLRSKDPAAPVAIRAWIAERISTGQNKPDDPKIIEATKCAEIMEKERERFA